MQEQPYAIKTTCNDLDAQTCSNLHLKLLYMNVQNQFSTNSKFTTCKFINLMLVDRPNDLLFDFSNLGAWKLERSIFCNFQINDFAVGKLSYTRGRSR